jgi:putative thioredoxin
MAIDVTEATFDRDVVELSRQTPVVVDFWAEWCGPCKALSPALEAAEASRGGRVLLAKVDVDTSKALGARYGVQGIPAVKAFRDGTVVSEFTGAIPKAQVESFFDALVPSKVDELLEKGDELSLREAAELEPRRADVAVALGRARLERGAEDEALEAVESHPEDFAAQGIAARIRLARAGIGADAFAALDRGERKAALDSLIGEIESRLGGPEGGGRGPDAESAAAAGILPEDVRDLLRRAIVGILSDLDPADPSARDYRRKLATALG